MAWFWSRGWIGLSMALYLGGTATLVYAVAHGASPYILAIAFPSLFLVGLVIGVRRPQVKVGQLLAVSGGGWACSIALLPSIPSVVGDGVLFASHLVAPLGVSALIGALLVFPDGQLLSPRWKWIVPALGLFVLDGVGRALAVVEQESSVLDRLADWWFLIGILLLLASLTSLVIRARHGSGVVRRQVGWFAYGVASYVAFLIIADSFFGFGAPDEDPAWVAIDQIFFTAIPLTIWVAVSRYRLYDLDRLVSRTVAYAAVVVVLAATYLGALAIVSSMLPVDDEIGVAVSTLAVVAMFSPVRRRVLAVVDRRFFRTRYQSQDVFERFARRLRARTVVGADVIEGDILAVLEETLAPQRAGVWIRPS